MGRLNYTKQDHVDPKLRHWGPLYTVNRQAVFDSQGSYGQEMRINYNVLKEFEEAALQGYEATFRVPANIRFKDEFNLGLKIDENSLVELKGWQITAMIMRLEGDDPYLAPVKS